MFTADLYAGQPEADIEDIIGRANYVELVNKTYQLSGARALPAAKPANVPARVLKEAEEHFRTLPVGTPEFDHYTPAEYLTVNGAKLTVSGAKLKKTLPDLDGALERFEKLFHDLNALLR